MKKKLLYRSAVMTATLGLAIIFIVMLSGVAYPHMLFRIGTPIGLALVFASVVLLLLHWLMEIGDGIRKKQYLWVALLAGAGLIVIVRILIRI